MQRQLDAKCRLENNRGIPSKETSFNIAKGLFKGIYALHKYGFIHQGLTLKNIILKLFFLKLQSEAYECV